jgi:hypothetical protein
MNVIQVIPNYSDTRQVWSDDHRLIFLPIVGWKIEQRDSGEYLAHPLPLVDDDMIVLQHRCGEHVSYTCSGELISKERIRELFGFPE